jgi:hypothetical protein
MEEIHQCIRDNWRVNADEITSTMSRSCKKKNGAIMEEVLTDNFFSWKKNC